jgi:hypothetical protein
VIGGGKRSCGLPIGGGQDVCNGSGGMMSEEANLRLFSCGVGAGVRLLWCGCVVASGCSRRRKRDRQQPLALSIRAHGLEMLNAVLTAKHESNFGVG